MARYYRDKKLTITGIVPGSNVGVWKTDEPGQRTFQIKPVFLKQCQGDRVTFPVPDGELVVRVRNKRYSPVEQRFHTNEMIDGTVYIAQMREYL